MRVAIYPADDGGCGRYRLRWPAEALTAQGADVLLTIPGGQDPDIRGWFRDRIDLLTGQRHGMVMEDVIAPDADVVVLQRPLRQFVVQAIPMLQAKGLKVVVEIDDDFTALHRRNVSWANVHPKLHPDRNHQWLTKACGIADHVVVTTPALARRYGRHGRVTVVPNCVPARYLDARRSHHDETYVGWTGSIDTHPTDLQVAGDGIARAVQDTGATFAVIGTGKGVRAALGLRADSVACGWVDIDLYPDAYAQLDVAVVPLDAIAFNHAKSWLKLLEGSALGVPVVASPTDDNVRGAMLGMGVLAARPREWRREVTRLVQRPDHRLELAARSREAAAAWTIEGNCDRWWDAWTAPLRAREAA